MRVLGAVATMALAAGAAVGSVPAQAQAQPQVVTQFDAATISRLLRLPDASAPAPNSIT